MHKYLNFNSSKNLEPYKSILLNDTEKDKLRKDINSLLKIRNAVIIAHYYTDPDIQQLAEETNGCVADSLEMAKFGSNHSASTLMVAGVRFMGETAKILNPEKTVLMPTLLAECSLDLSCPRKEFSAFCDTYPDRTVVVYANTSAAVKARADWVVTSSIAVDVIDYLDNLGKKIIWGPDYNLGRYIQKKTGADMLFWHGTCIVHDEFKAQALINMKKIYPDAAILAHPESPENILQLADIIGSTSQLIYAIQNLSNRRIIVATDKGIMYKMQQLYPKKIFLEAPTSGEGAICHSCAHCPWMSLNNLKSLANGLLNNNHQHEIYIEEIIRRKALISLNRMLTFLKKQKIS